jgi:hypothetical protein
MTRKERLACVTCLDNFPSFTGVRGASKSEIRSTMKLKRAFAHLLPVGMGLWLLIWGLETIYTAFRHGAMAWAGWQTDAKGWFGITVLTAYFVVLLPAYLYAVSLGVRGYKKSVVEGGEHDGRWWLMTLGVSILLGMLTFCTRVAITAWFPSPMHPPFGAWTGGVIPGILATVALLLMEAGVLFSIKHQARGQQQPLSLLIPGFFGLLLLTWAGWITYTAFTEGSLPVVGWQTQYPKLFGLAWVIAFFVVLLPAYVYSIGLGILGWLERNMEQQLSPQNHWLVAIGITALLSLVTYCTRIAVTAWFPEPMHPPFHNFQGGLLGGGITTVVLTVVMVIFYRVARSL